MDMVPHLPRAEDGRFRRWPTSPAIVPSSRRATISAARFFTGRVTAAGKVSAGKGAGHRRRCGLAAIGTATSLGAITCAFDVRPSGRADRKHRAEFIFLDFRATAKTASQRPAVMQHRPRRSSAKKRLEKFRELARDRYRHTTALI